MPQEKTPDNIKEIVLYAWVGEDEFGSGEVGLKQGLCAAGYIPLVSCKDNKVNRDYLREGLQQQANEYGKTIRLCKFVFKEEVETLNPERENR